MAADTTFSTISSGGGEGFFFFLIFCVNSFFLIKNDIFWIFLSKMEFLIWRNWVIFGTHCWNCIFDIRNFYIKKKLNSWYQKIFCPPYRCLAIQIPFDFPNNMTDRLELNRNRHVNRYGRQFQVAFQGREFFDSPIKVRQTLWGLLEYSLANQS